MDDGSADDGPSGEWKAADGRAWRIRLLSPPRAGPWPGAIRATAGLFIPKEISQRRRERRETASYLRARRVRSEPHAGPTFGEKELNHEGTKGTKGNTEGDR